MTGTAGSNGIGRGIGGSFPSDGGVQETDIVAMAMHVLAVPTNRSSNVSPCALDMNWWILADAEATVLHSASLGLSDSVADCKYHEKWG